MIISNDPISHPSFAQAWDTVTQCHDSIRKRGRAETLCMPGVSGVGKSTLLKRYREKHPPVQEAGKMRFPVVYVAIPARPTFKQFVLALLNAIDAPLTKIGNANEQLDRFKVLSKACCVELLVVDEMQHFVDRGSVRTYGAVADELKVLFDDLQIPMILAGAPRMRILFETNGQLRRRFKPCLYLRPFSIEHEFEYFRGFVNTIAVKLMLPDAKRLSEPTMAEKLWYATDGIPANVIDLIDRLDQILHRKPAAKWTNHDLAQAFREAIWRDAPDRLNPFLNNRQEALRRLNLVGEPYQPPILDGDNHGLPISFVSSEDRETT